MENKGFCIECNKQMDMDLVDVAIYGEVRKVNRCMKCGCLIYPEYIDRSYLKKYKYRKLYSFST